MYRSNVDGNDETCDIEKEHEEASNQTIVGDSKLDSDGDQMAGEQSLENLKQPLEESDNHLDCEQNWHAGKIDIACDKGDRKSIDLMHAGHYLVCVWMVSAILYPLHVEHSHVTRLTLSLLGV